MPKVYLTFKIDVKDAGKLMNASKAFVQENWEGQAGTPEWEPEDESDAVYEVVYGNILKNEEAYGIDIMASSTVLVDNEDDEAFYDNDLFGVQEDQDDDSIEELQGI